jgi:hypothetical protein
MKLVILHQPVISKNILQSMEGLIFRLRVFYYYYLFLQSIYFTNRVDMSIPGSENACMLNLSIIGIVNFVKN